MNYAVEIEAREQYTENVYAIEYSLHFLTHTHTGDPQKQRKINTKTQRENKKTKEIGDWLHETAAN